jgi:hypothetical protein
MQAPIASGRHPDKVGAGHAGEPVRHGRRGAHGSRGRQELVEGGYNQGRPEGIAAGWRESVQAGEIW